MKTHIPTLALAVSLIGAACGSTQTTTRNGTVANPATNPTTGTTITTSTGQAVSQDANSRFNTAAQAMKTHDDANNGRGDWANDSCSDVAEQFEDAAEAQPQGNFPEAWFNRGLVFLRCNNNEQATAAFNRAIQAANGNYCRAKVQLGVMQYRAHNVDQARSMFEEAVRADPTHCVEGYTNLAMVLREANPTTDQQWTAVIANIRQALALDDRYLPARTQLALSYLQQAGDDPNSQRVFLAGLVCNQAAQVAVERASELSAEERGFLADIHNTWGIVDIRRGEIIKALGHFQRAYQLNPSMFEAWVNYGTINLSFRGYSDAREAFQHAVELRADSYDAHIGLGVALRGLAAASENRDQAMLTQAQQEYERAQQIDANRADSYYNLGVLNLSYMGGQIADLERARGLLVQFQQHAGQTARYAEHLTRAAQHIRNIDQTLAAMRAMASIPGASGGGATPPAGGATPPAGGATPPTPTTPPAAGTTPPAAPAPTAH